MTRTLSTFVFSTALALLSLTAQALELDDSPMSLASDDGLQATIAPSGDGSQALVKITGIDHPLDGVVMLTNVETRTDNVRAYRAEVDGKARSLLVYSPSPWSTSDYTAYIPGQQEPRALRLDEAGHSSIDLQALAAEYQQQQENGVQDQLARFDRDQAIRRQQQALNTIDESASEVCGSQVATRVDWTALNNQQLNNLNISGYCGQVAAEIEHMCRRDKGFKRTVSQISAVDCGFADTTDLRRDGGKLVFRTREDGQSQRESINGFLKTLGN